MTKRFGSEVLDTHIPELKVEHTFGMPNSSIGQVGRIGLHKRASFPVLLKEVDDPSLNELSKAPSKRMKSYYTFFREAAQGVLVIVLEIGFPDISPNLTQPEF